MAIFDVSQYQELLAKRASLTKKNKDLFSDPIFLELMSVKSSVETQVFYNHKNSYFALIQNYLGKTINPNGFRGSFIQMVKEDLRKSRKILNNFEELSTFWIDLELDDFASLFEDIYETCLYAFEFEDQKDAMPEDTFRDSIQKIFFKIQKYSDEG